MSLLFTDVLVWMGGEATLPTDVLVTGQRIAAIGPQARRDAPRDARVFAGGRHQLLVPGLINAHFHSPANHLKGALPSLPLEVFMLYETSADEALRPSPREAYLRTMLGAIEMLRGGTTAVQDDAFLMPTAEPEIIDAIMQAYADSGIRATLALDQPELAEIDKLPFLGSYVDGQARDAILAPAPMPMNDLLERYRYLVDRWHGAADGRLRAAVSISAPQRVSREYFAALDEISDHNNLPLFAHMLETKVQRLLASEVDRFGGLSLVEYTAEIGLLNERTNVIHAVWVDDVDLDLIAAAGASVAHNPVSNLRLGSGIMPFRAMRDRGIPIALGVDEAICNDAVDMWNVIRMTGLIHNVTGQHSDKWPTAAEVLDCLWTGGATAMRLGDDLGAIEVGRLADLALIELNSASFTPLNDVTGQLVYCESGQNVVLTVVDGVPVSQDGRVTSVDEESLLDEVRALYDDKQALLGKSRGAAAALVPAYQAVVRRAASIDIGMNRWAG